MAHSKRAEKHPAKKPARRSQASSAASAKAKESPNLRALYVELAGNLDKLSAFIADPEAVAKSAGLSEEERELLFSGDGVRIYASLRPGVMETLLKQQPAGTATGEAAQAAPPATPPPQAFPAAQGYPGWPWTMPYGYGSAAAYQPPAYQAPAAPTMLSSPAPQPSQPEQER